MYDTPVKPLRLSQCVQRAARLTPSPLGEMFNNERFCDGLIRVLPEDSIRLNNAAACYRVVRGVVASESEYFDRAFGGWKEECSTKELEVRVPWTQVHTCGLLLSFMHDKELPSLEVEKLLSLLELADRFVVHSCLSEVCCQLGEARLSSLVEALKILELEGRPGVSLQPGMRLAREKARFVLLRKFGDVEKVAQSKDLMEAFLGLSKVAVTELFAQDRLQAVSENTVFYLATRWFSRHYRDARPTDPSYYQAVMEVGAQIRFPVMSSNFICHWAQKTKWMKDFQKLTNVWLREATEFKLRESTVANPDEEPREEMRFHNRANTSPSNTLSWEVSADSLLDEPRVCQSPKMFCGGYLWKLVMKTKEESPDRLALYLPAYPSFPEYTIRNSLYKGAPLQIKGTITLSAERRGEDGEVSRRLEDQTWGLSSGWGFGDFFAEPLDSVLMENSPYTDANGNLHVAATIEDVE
ncbi:hypothetical protein BSKO_02996 [Bryopsis sp. KO-2023]|nr:hypothetical protein BSKO_02996 [Bryopsis sp. KO-2023]